MRKYILTLFFIVLKTNGFAQCKTIKPFTTKSIADINDIFQFTFLHYPLQNKLDSLVFQLNYPMYVTDSSLYNWPTDGGKIRSVLDVFDYSKAINAIGKLQTPEAFFILNLPYIYRENVTIRDWKKADDLSPYNSMMSSIPHYGGATILNKYYLKQPVRTYINKQQWEANIIKQIEPLRQNNFKNIKYCLPLTGDDYSLAMMQKEDATECDSAVIKIINKYINKYKNVVSYYSIDSIVLEIHQLPKFIDMQTDQCMHYVSADDGNSSTRIGVIYKTAPRYPWENYSTILRVYSINNNVYKGQSISNIEYSVNFISDIRKSCEE